VHLISHLSHSPAVFFEDFGLLGVMHNQRLEIDIPTERFLQDGEPVQILDSCVQLVDFSHEVGLVQLFSHIVSVDHARWPFSRTFAVSLWALFISQVVFVTLTLVQFLKVLIQVSFAHSLQIVVRLHVLLDKLLSGFIVGSVLWVFFKAVFSIGKNEQQPRLRVDGPRHIQAPKKQ